MSKINPELRFWFEELPIDVKNKILESGAVIRTRKDLELCLQHLEEQEHCCGDL